MKATVIAVAVMMASGAASASTTQQQIDDLRAGLHQVHLNTLGKYSESWGLEDRANISKLQEQKLDKSLFTADQQRQDKALSDSISKQAETDAKQTSDLKSYADKKATSAYQTSVAHTDAKVARADADRAKGDAALQAQMESDRQQSTDRDSVNAAAITAESQARAEANVKLAAGISAAQSTGDYAASRSDAALRNAATNAQAIRNTNEKVAEHSRTLANHEQRLGNLEQQTNRQFADMKGRIDRVEKRANAGASAALSASSIPQVTEYQRFSVGAGVGGYEGESALAVGLSSRLSSAVVLKASVTTDSQHGFGYGAGISLGW